MAAKEVMKISAAQIRVSTAPYLRSSKITTKTETRLIIFI